MSNDKKGEKGRHTDLDHDYYFVEDIYPKPKVWEMEIVDAVAATNATRIAESGVSAARQANAPYDWFVDWAKEDLPDLVAQGNIRAYIELEKRENTWLSRAKKAFWYVVGIIATAIVTYYVALAGFKV